MARFGNCVENAPGSQEALKVAGLDWKVVQKPIFTEEGQLVDGFKAISGTGITRFWE